MRRKNAVVLTILLIFSIYLVGCGVKYDEAKIYETSTSWGEGYFTIVKKWGGVGECQYMIVYANDTKVMYYVDAITVAGGITPLFNADGTLQLYEGESQ